MAAPSADFSRMLMAHFSPAEFMGRAVLEIMQAFPVAIAEQPKQSPPQSSSAYLAAGENVLEVSAFRLWCTLCGAKLALDAIIAEHK